MFISLGTEFSLFKSEFDGFYELWDLLRIGFHPMGLKKSESSSKFTVDPYLLYSPFSMQFKSVTYGHDERVGGSHGIFGGSRLFFNKNIGIFTEVGGYISTSSFEGSLGLSIGF